MTATASAIAAFEASFPQLAGAFGPANVAELLDGASIQEFPAGRKLIRDRMPVECIYFVLAGELSAYIEEGGKSRKISAIKPGEWLGEISVLSGELVASATVVSDSPCRLLKVHHLTLQRLISENETVAKVLLEALIALMAERLRTPPANLVEA